MPILTPGCQGPFDGELRLVRADNHATAIVGTAEKMCVCYPIAVRKNDDGSFAWDYTGGTPKEYDETAEIEFDDNGEPLFQDEDGNDVPASQVAILDKDGREVGRLGSSPQAVATGRNILGLPYNLDRTADDASILASLGRWIDAQPSAVARSIAAHFQAEAAGRSKQEEPTNG